MGKRFECPRTESKKFNAVWLVVMFFEIIIELSTVSYFMILLEFLQYLR